MFLFNLWGTLLNQYETINNETILEIKKIYKQNNLIAITTSKSYKDCASYLDIIKDYVHFFIGNNGAILIDNVKKDLLKTPRTLKVSFVERILKDVEILGGAVQIITSRKQFINSHINFFKSQKWLSETVKQTMITPFLPYNINDNTNRNEIIQLTIIINPELIDELINYFKKFYGKDYEFKRSSKVTLDVNLAGVNKYEGLKIIMNYYNISPQNVFCFGNSINDLELIQNIKNTYAMENSIPIIKDLAQDVIGAVDSNTVALKIQEILKNDK